MDSNSKRYRCMYPSYVFLSESNFNLGLNALKCGHKMEQYADIIAKDDEIIRSDNGSQLPEGQGGIIEVF